MEQRRKARYRVRFPVALIGDLMDGGGLVIDLSTGGCRIRTEERINDHAYIRLILHPANDTSPIKAELAIVRWVRDQEIGLEFIRMSLEQQERLRQLVYLLKLGTGLEILRQPEPLTSSNQ